MTIFTSTENLPEFDIRDDFAGPGGWDVALRMLGSAQTMLGVEFDSSACLTAAAAGHDRFHGTVQSLRDGGPRVKRHISSPPCQTFSQGGKKAGFAALAHLIEAAQHVAAGMLPEDAIAAVNDDALDERSVLVLEPLFVTQQHRPEWVALEQVPTVLPVWQAFVTILETMGYKARAEVLNAEQYGVPQARRRAILVAVREDVLERNGLTEVPWAEATHSKFHARNKAKRDEGVLPFVTMAEALSWGMTERPYPTVACSRSTGGPDKEKVGGSAARAIIYTEKAEGRWVPERAIEGDEVSMDWVEERPSPTIVGSFRPEVVAAPGYRKPGDPPRQKTPGSVRITLEQAGVLQSFPADYPWQGTSTKQFQQVGNAIPPLMAAAVLAGLVNL